MKYHHMQLHKHTKLIEGTLLIYRNTAIAILSHKNWKDALRVCIQKEGRGSRNVISPMRMLVEHMPGIPTAIVACMTRFVAAYK